MAAAARKSIVKRVYVIRHAEAEHQQKTNNGSANPGLTATGVAQATKMSGPCELLVVSPLKRTMQTYAYSKLTVKRLVTSELIREWKGYGPSCWTELEAEDASFVSAAKFDDMDERVEETVKWLTEQPEISIALLSHAMFLEKFMTRIGMDKGKCLSNAEVVDCGWLDFTHSSGK